MKIRFPRTAGTFYDARPEALRKQVEDCFSHTLGVGSLPRLREDGPRKVLALISPHAGYMYSGPVASHAYHRLAEDGRPNVFIILGPNHTGFGSGVSLMVEGAWRTPLGDSMVDSEVAAQIVKASTLMDVDEQAHRFEHSIEVQLPFLQFIYGTVRIVPICFLMQDLETSREVGEAIAEAVKGLNAVIIASTDLTHYEPQRVASVKDHRVIEAIQGLQEATVQEVVESNSVSMCGPGPVMATLVAARRLGAQKADLLCYKTSGDITGDYGSVVGYASLLFTK